VADAYFHRYYRGILLRRIAYSLGVPEGDHARVCKELNTAFKEYLCVKSTGDFSNHTFLVYMSAILMLMAREKGVLIPFFNESDDIEEMPMNQWIELQKLIDK
jgi:hypothetical protein